MKKQETNESSQRAQTLRHCDKCETKKPPEGGIEMRPGRWLCASCWLRRYRY
jgi:hypothetical protein